MSDNDGQIDLGLGDFQRQKKASWLKFSVINISLGIIKVILRFQKSFSLPCKHHHAAALSILRSKLYAREMEKLLFFYIRRTQFPHVLSRRDLAAWHSMKSHLPFPLANAYSYESNIDIDSERSK